MNGYYVDLMMDMKILLEKILECIEMVKAVDGNSGENLFFYNQI